MTTLTPDVAPANRMSSDVLAAYADIQTRLLRATSPLLIERYERALNEFLHHPERVGTPAKLVNVASGNAGKVVRGRAKRTIPLTSAYDNIHNPEAEVPFLKAQLRCLIDGTCRTPRERRVAHLLLNGNEATEIARVLRITEVNARVIISRVRRWLQASVAV